MLRLIFTSYFGALAVLSLFVIKTALLGVSLCFFCIFIVFVLNYKE